MNRESADSGDGVWRCGVGGEVVRVVWGEVGWHRWDGLRRGGWDGCGRVVWGGMECKMRASAQVSKLNVGS